MAAVVATSSNREQSQIEGQSVIMHEMHIELFDDPSQMFKEPAEVRIKSVEIQPYPDGRRILARFSITPFRQRPSLEVKVLNNASVLAAMLNVIDAMSPEFEVTLHLRDGQPSGEYTLNVDLFYVSPGESRQQVDSYQMTFDLTAATRR